jgi:hypothetical protein
MARLSSTAISNSNHFLNFIFGWAPSILHRYQVEAKLKKTFCVMTFDHKLSPVSHFVVSFQNSSLLTKIITPREDCFKEDASSKYTSPSSLQSWILNIFGRSMLCSSQSQDRLALMIHTPSCKCNFRNNISHFGILTSSR